MMGFSQVLAEDYGPGLGPTGLDYARRIAKSAARMDELIRDLLAYSRISRHDVTIESVDLDELLTEAESQLVDDVKARNARLLVERPLPVVLANRLMLTQAIVNLLSNALKFVPAGNAPLVRVRTELAGEFVRLWVEDNGIGISPAHHERIFKIFERLNQTEDYPGTGVGLAIVKRAIERVGGRVGVESELGKGSRFWLDLPMLDAPG